MSINVQAVINAAADEADNLLEGVANAAEAKPLLREWLADNHPSIPKAERDKIVVGVIGLLEREGFFGSSGHGDSWDDAGEGGEPDE